MPSSDSETPSIEELNLDGSLLFVRNQERVTPPPHGAPRQQPLTKCISPRSAYLQQLLDGFLRDYVPMGQLGPLEERPWILRLPEIALTKALEVSILAVSIAKLCRQRTDLALVKEGQKLYAQGPWELQKSPLRPGVDV
jgi:hypothetical protein